MWRVRRLRYRQLNDDDENGYNMLQLLLTATCYRYSYAATHAAAAHAAVFGVFENARRVAMTSAKAKGQEQDRHDKRENGVTFEASFWAADCTILYVSSDSLGSAPMNLNKRNRSTKLV